jgi:hypothetical protein
MAPGMQEECLGGLSPPLHLSKEGAQSSGLPALGSRVEREMVLGPALSWDWSGSRPVRSCVRQLPSVFPGHT